MVEFIGLLKVKVIKGTNLAIRDMMSSDPYVILTLGQQVSYCSFFTFVKWTQVLLISFLTYIKYKAPPPPHTHTHIFMCACVYIIFGQVIACGALDGVEWHKWTHVVNPILLELRLSWVVCLVLLLRTNFLILKVILGSSYSEKKVILGWWWVGFLLKWQNIYLYCDVFII